MGLIHTFPASGVYTFGPKDGTIPAKAKILTASGSHSWSAWSEFFAATAVKYPVYGIRVTFLQEASSSKLVRMLEVGVGAASSEKTILPSVPMREWTYNPSGHDTYYFPVYIPAGTRISARVRMSTTGSGDNVAAYISLEHLQLPHMDSFHQVEPLGVTVDGSNTSMKNITPGNGTFGSYVALGGLGTSGVLKFPAKAISFVLGNGGGGMGNSEKFRTVIGIGASGSQKEVIEFLSCGFQGSADAMCPSYHGPYALDLPAGAEVWAKMMGVNTDVRDIAAFAMG